MSEAGDARPDCAEALHRGGRGGVEGLRGEAGKGGPRLPDPARDAAPGVLPAQARGIDQAEGIIPRVAVRIQTLRVVDVLEDRIGLGETA